MNRRVKIGTVLAFLAFVGIVDSFYISASYITGDFAVCRIGEGCDAVLTSKYAILAGIPISFIGAIYYLLLFAVSVFFLETGGKKAIALAVVMSTVGLFVSILLAGIQLFVIKAVCEFCVASAFITLTYWIVSVMEFSRARKSGFEENAA